MTKRGSFFKYGLLVLVYPMILTCGIFQTLAVPVNKVYYPEEDTSNQQEYENLKQLLVFDHGYTQEFADLVEVNLKRAISEEKLRQQINIVDSFDTPASTLPSALRQNPNQAIDEYEDDESTTPTTAGASTGDVVRGIAQLLSSLGTFNIMHFWGSFVNFFPPSQRQTAMALVDAALGRRPQQWPTLPTTTTKLTTSTKDEFYLDSEETTKAAVTAAPGVQGATLASVPSTLTAMEGMAYIPGSQVPQAPPPPLPPTKASTAKPAIKRMDMLPEEDNDITLNEQVISDNEPVLRISSDIFNAKLEPMASLKVQTSAAL